LPHLGASRVVTNGSINEIEEYLGYQRSMAHTHRQGLPTRLQPAIEARKKGYLMLTSWLPA
jgi:hypothetical protein